MDVVGHQHPGPHLDAGGRAMLGEQVQVAGKIGIVEESLRAAVAPLGDMVRVTSKDGAGEASHEGQPATRR